MPSKYSIEYPGNKPHKSGTLFPLESEPPTLVVPLAGSSSVILGPNFFMFDPNRCDVHIVAGEINSNEISPNLTVTRLQLGAATEITSRPPHVHTEAATRISIERF